MPKLFQAHLRPLTKSDEGVPGCKISVQYVVFSDLAPRPDWEPNGGERRRKSRKAILCLCREQRRMKDKGCKGRGILAGLKHGSNA